MKKWISKNKMFLMSVIIGLIMTPITYEEIRVDCSSTYECCVFCFIYVLAVGCIGVLMDRACYKECEK